MSGKQPIDTLSKVLIAPLVSEKASRSGERENSVSFWVNPKSSKHEIKQAVEQFLSKCKGRVGSNTC